MKYARFFYSLNLPRRFLPAKSELVVKRLKGRFQFKNPEFNLVPEWDRTLGTRLPGSRCQMHLGGGGR